MRIGIPDYSEMGMEVEEWKEWFVDTCCLILKKMREGECTIFTQTDVKVVKVCDFIFLMR